MQDQAWRIPVPNLNLTALAETCVRRLRARGWHLLERLQHILDVQVLVRKFLLRPLIGLLGFIEKLAHL